MDESTASWWLGPDGTWTRHHLDESGLPLMDLQDHLIRFRQTRAGDADVAATKSRPRPERLARG
jgi:polyphosphate kinase